MRKRRFPFTVEMALPTQPAASAMNVTGQRRGHGQLWELGVLGTSTSAETSSVTIWLAFDSLFGAPRPLISAPPRSSARIFLSSCFPASSWRRWLRSAAELDLPACLQDFEGDSDGQAFGLVAQSARRLGPWVGVKEGQWALGGGDAVAGRVALSETPAGSRENQSRGLAECKLDERTNQVKTKRETSLPLARSPAVSLLCSSCQAWSFRRGSLRAEAVKSLQKRSVVIWLFLRKVLDSIS